MKLTKDTFLFYSALLTILTFFLVISRDYGITFDEVALHVYGKHVYNYYSSGFNDLRALDFLNIHYYGGLFELLAYSLSELDFIRTDHARRFVNASFFWLLCLAICLFARRHFPKYSWWIAIILIFASPRLWAHGMNNPKDLPFATFYIVTVYFLSLAKSQFPYYSKATTLGIILSIALSINIRSGGLLLLACTLLFIALLFIKETIKNKNLSVHKLGKLGLLTTFLSITTLLLGCLFWPWAKQKPIIRIFESLHYLITFDYRQDFIFKGSYTPHFDVPFWEYFSTWLFISTPIVILLGMLIGLIFIFQSRNKIWVQALLLTSFTPILIQLISNTHLYDGIRHFLFIYACLLIIAVYGISMLLLTAREKCKSAIFYSGVLAIAIMTFQPLFFSYKNHPNQLVYFNQTIGGIQGAYKKYELDYWANCVKQAIDWLDRKAQEKNQTLNITATYPWDITRIYCELYPNLTYISPDHESTADYRINFFRGNLETIDQLASLNNIVHSISVEDVPICTISKLH